MLSYKEIVKYNDDDLLKKSIECVSDLFDSLSEDHKEKLHEFMIHQVGIFNKSHFDCESAWYVIDKMRDVKNIPVKSLLEEKGLNPTRVKEMIEDAYHRANNYSIEHGFQAPSIPPEYNEYDYFVTMAMCMADFWYTTKGEEDKVADLAYEWLSDPDSNTTKAWDYFF